MTPKPSQPSAPSEQTILDSLNTSRRIELVPVTKLKGDPKNPKAHALSDIDDSYQRFGVVDVITVDGRTGFILSGHGRATVLQNAYAEGDTPPEGITIDPVTNEWLVPVVAGWSSKNDAEAAAALISMNRLTELGGWADEALLGLLDEISASGATFDGVGFSETDQDDLRALLDGLGQDKPDLDEKPKGVAAGGGAKAVTIKLSDPGLIDFWHEIRDTYKTDDEAFRSLAAEAGHDIDVDPDWVPPVKRGKAAKTGSNRIAEPTLDDLEDDETPSDSTAVDNPVDEDDEPGMMIDFDDLPDSDPDE